MTRRRTSPRVAREEARRASDFIPLPAHPYRDSALFYGALAGALVAVTYFTGGGMLKALLFAGGFFVIATAFSWWRFRMKLAQRSQEQDE